MPPTVLPFEGYVSKVDSGRQARASHLMVRLTFLDFESGLFRGQVDPSKKGEPYAVKIDARDKNCSCTCQDFLLRAKPCKHLAAFAAICKRALHGLTAGQLSSATDVGQ